MRKKFRKSLRLLDQMRSQGHRDEALMENKGRSFSIIELFLLQFSIMSKSKSSGFDGGKFFKPLLRISIEFLVNYIGASHSADFIFANFIRANAF